MKLTRLLLMLALVVSFLMAPEAFGAKKHSGGGALSHSRNKAHSAMDCYDVYCGGSSPDASCCGSVGDCLNFCDGVCGVPSGTCIYVQ